MSQVAHPSGRVVVTGVGAVTPLGTGVETFWSRLTAGESGIGPITLFDVSEYPTRIAGEVKDFNAEDWLDRKEARRIDRFIAFAVASARMALDDSGLPISDADIAKKTGVLVGSGIGGLTFLGEQVRRLHEGGPSKVSPFLVPYMIPDNAVVIPSVPLVVTGLPVTERPVGTDSPIEVTVPEPPGVANAPYIAVTTTPTSGATTKSNVPVEGSVSVQSLDTPCVWSWPSA